MIHPKNMTIDAYLRHAGVKETASERQKNFIPLKRMPGSRFGEVLGAMQTTDNRTAAAHSKGATIADYLSLRSPSVESALFRHSTIHSSSLTGSVPGRHRIMPVLTVQNRDDKVPVTDREAVAPTAVPAAPEPDIDTLIGRSIRTAASKYNLSAELIESIIRTESNFQPDAVSPAGAQGLMQLMPATARELGVTDPFDVQQNIDGGTRYIRQMLDRFDGNVKLALAAYNAGPGTVARYDGDVPYPETRDYVQRVLSGIKSMDASKV